MQGVTVMAQFWSHMWGVSPGWMWLIMPLSWLVVAATIVLLVRAVSGPSTDRERERDDPAERPRRILAERFARGEIDRDEYRERLEVLAAGR